MYATDENSEPIRKGKRRSSILKIPKSPAYVLDDIDPNTENVEETVQRSKKARRSSSRRVSFAETCQIKEIPNEVLEKMRNTDDFMNTDENNCGPYESTSNNSSYRPAAATLKGLSSLLTSPIQESPPNPVFQQFSPDESVLDFTCYQQPGSNVQDNLRQSQNAMEMTKNYEGWDFEQSTVLTSRFSSKCPPENDDGQLDFTRSHGAYIQNNQLNTTAPQDVMEMTRNYEGWQLEQSTLLTRQVVSSKVAILNQRPKLNGSHFLEELQANDSMSNMSFERRNSLDKQNLLRSKASAQSPKRDGASFLNQLRTSSFQSQEREKYVNPFLAEAHLQPIVEGDELEFTQCLGGNIQDSSSDDEVTINPMEMTRNYEGWQTALRSKPVHSPRRNGASFLSQLTTAKSTSNYQPQQRDDYGNPTFGKIPLATSNLHHTMWSTRNEDNLDLTQCVGGNIAQHVDNDNTCDQMEMTKNYENWEKENLYVPRSRTPEKENIVHPTRSPEKDNSLDFTRCQTGKIVTSQAVDEDVDVEADQIEMTRSYENWEMEKSNMVRVQSKTSSIDSNSRRSNKRSSPEKDNSLDFTRCKTGNIVTSQTVEEDVTADQMEMTRNYEHWEIEKSNMVAMPLKTPRIDSNSRLSIKRSSPEKEENLDFTRCLDGKIETLQCPIVDEDVTTTDQMEMTRNYENWEMEKSIIAQQESKTRRNDYHNIVQKVSQKREEVANVQANLLGQDHDLSSCVESGVLNEALEPSHAIGRLKPSVVKIEGKLNISSHVEMSESQTQSLMKADDKLNVSGFKKMSENHPTMVKTEPRATSQKMNVLRHLQMSENQTSMMVEPRVTDETMNVSRDIKIPESQPGVVKAVPRAMSSKIRMDQSFQRFEIKLPNSKIGKVPVCKSEEKPGVEPEVHSVSQAPTSSLSQSLPSSSCAQDMATTSLGQSSYEIVDKKEPEDIENEASAKIFNDSEQPMTMMDISTNLAEVNNTTTEQEQMKSVTEAESEKEYIAEEKPLEVPYTLKEFMSNAGITFLQHVTRRSETPMFKCDIPKDLKDKIYARCLSDAKLQIMDDFSRELQEEIAKNGEIFAAKEKKMNAKNPPVFGKLQKVMGTDIEDVVVEVIKQLNRVGCARGKRLWYNKKKEMRKRVLASLQEQERKLAVEASLIKKHQSELDEDITMLEKVEADYADKQIEELQATLESDEKEWAQYLKDADELKQKLETFELELQSKEDQRAQLSSVKECLTSEVAEQKTKITEIESDIEKLTEEEELRESIAEEVEKFVPFHKALQEWILVKHDDTELKLTFVGQTLDLNVTFEDAQKIKDIQLISQISEISIPLALLGHQLIIEKFAQCDLLATFPTRNKLPELLHQVSLACVRVRILLKTMGNISINHIVSVSDKILTVEFSSLAKFTKFILNFDLSKLVTDGDIAFTVVRKIGTISTEAISEQLNQFPSTIVYLSKILNAADEMLR